MSNFISFVVDQSKKPQKSEEATSAAKRVEGPVFIDRDRMDRALAGPFFTLPEGLTPAEIVAHFRNMSRLHK
ncbi:hypothetical protein ACQYWY_21720 [Comamonas sediminis]|uniref:hypothetical protein n=1 Tax=Comamonas sediminis TaxID=1783360 RepID=UPI003D299BBB